jgi:hypothetical protein
MVSLVHEGLISLVREQPAFIADVLTQLLNVDVPRSTEARLVEATLNELVPVEYRADAVVLFGGRKPVFGVVVEAQLQRRRRKRYTWPLYVVAARARHECPFLLVVVAPKASTARWAAQPIEIGGGMVQRPCVIGPDGIPRITDPGQASRDPRLAVLSVVAHGREDPHVAARIAAAATTAIDQLPDQHKLLYLALIDSALSSAARKEFAMLPDWQKFMSASQRRFLAQGEAQGRVQGRAQGRAQATTETLAEALVTVLKQRQFVVTRAQQRRISGCTDVATLRRWLKCAVSVGSVDDLFA